MSIALWEPSKDYALGDLVQPSTVPANVAAPFANADFELGNQDWTVVGGSIVLNPAQAWEGDYCVALEPSATPDRIGYCESSAFPVQEGRSFVVACYYKPNDTNATTGYLEAIFFDSGNNEIGRAKSNEVVSGSGVSGSYFRIALSVTVPVDAETVKFRGTSEHSTTPGLAFFDGFEWNYTTTASGAPIGLIFECTVAGKSNLTEPDWPDTVGDTVVDGEVTWTARAADTVTWQAVPLLRSGATEPTWPVIPGQVVRDGNMLWECQSQAITDPNCPQTKEVTIGASKIFAGDDDIVRFSATLAPRDWSSISDAGFLASGLQQKGQVGVEAMGIYRGNLVIWNASNAQVWQIDPDPVAMALLDSMDGIGSRHHRAAQAVANDMFFLSALGVRTVGIAVGAENLAAGDAGLPIDVLVQAEVNDQVDPIATFYPSMGQYWLAFPRATNGRPGTAPTPEDGDQFQFYLSTMLYPLDYLEALDGLPGDIGGFFFPLQQEAMDATVSMTGTLATVVQYEDFDVLEELDALPAMTGTLAVVVQYEDFDVLEELDASVALASGNLFVSVSFLEYSLNEQLDATVALQSATLA